MSGEVAASALGQAAGYATGESLDLGVCGRRQRHEQEWSIGGGAAGSLETARPTLHPACARRPGLVRCRGAKTWPCCACMRYAPRSQTLSQARAQSELEYLVKKGIARNRLSAKGYGAAKPQFSQCYADGLKRNPKLAGDVTVKLTVKRTTTAFTDVTVMGPQPSDPDFEQCVAKILDHLAIPPVLVQSANDQQDVFCRLQGDFQVRSWPGIAGRAGSSGCPRR